MIPPRALEEHGGSLVQRDFKCTRVKRVETPSMDQLHRGLGRSPAVTRQPSRRCDPQPTHKLKHFVWRFYIEPYCFLTALCIYYYSSTLCFPRILWQCSFCLCSQHRFQHEFSRQTCRNRRVFSTLRVVKASSRKLLSVCDLFVYAQWKSCCCFYSCSSLNLPNV